MISQKNVLKASVSLTNSQNFVYLNVSCNKLAFGWEQNIVLYSLQPILNEHSFQYASLISPLKDNQLPGLTTCSFGAYVKYWNKNQVMKYLLSLVSG